jgi:hypothetical protein
MEANGHSDAGTRLETWLGEAGFRSIAPGERRLSFSGPDLARQLPYVIAVVESTLADLAAASEATEAALRRGVTDLRALGRASHGKLERLRVSDHFPERGRLD